MNLRKKVKKLKAENEALKKLSSPFSKPMLVCNSRYLEPKKIRGVQTMHTREYGYLSEHIDEYMLNYMLIEKPVREVLKNNLKIEVTERPDLVTITADLTLYD